MTTQTHQKLLVYRLHKLILRLKKITKYYLLYLILNHIFLPYGEEFARGSGFGGGRGGAAKAASGLLSPEAAATAAAAAAAAAAWFCCICAVSKAVW